ncbi:hypothetical protein Goshw_008788 [Gossypium schwendimanii]|uniref:Uncharacterized protein n=1 Tax=Gossypium schwendimanii TaxID=34291 RepID=A0A7J9N4E0_GOSSC|nr:hypothetical protein [Gossypium schwendimanii]
MIPMAQPFQMMLGAYPSPFMYPNPYMFPFSSPMAGWSQWPGSSPFIITSSGPLMYRLVSYEGSQEGPSGALFLPNPITVWVSNSFAIGDANTFTVTILSRWLIIPTPTTRSPTKGTRIPTGATTTPTGSWTKEESSV